jgi:hypothetical protein
MVNRLNRSAWSILLAAAICLLLGARATDGVSAEPGIPDDFDTPLVIPSLPFTIMTDTTGATSALDDPAFTVCGLAPGNATLWFAFTPATNGSLVVDTLGSTYNTVLGVWYGTRGSLGTLGCNDDAGSTLQSRLVASLTAGTTYYIEVAEYSGTLDSPVSRGVGASLVINVRWMSSSIFTSKGGYDGWILENTEDSNQGLVVNSISETLLLGDGAGDRQYRAILSFRTGSLPDDAVITKVQVKIRRLNSNFLTGSNPFGLLGGLAIDMRKPFFGSDVVLRADDFQATADRRAAAIFNPKPVDGWYSTIINSLGYPFINRTGTTQLRLRYQIGDNDDGAADYMRFYSGNYATVTSRPTLIIEYFIP